MGAVAIVLVAGAICLLALLFIPAVYDRRHLIAGALVVVLVVAALYATVALWHDCERRGGTPVYNRDVMVICYAPGVLK